MIVNRYGEPVDANMVIESEVDQITTHHGLRCNGCRKLLAEIVSEPLSIMCPRCKVHTTLGLPPEN